MKLSPYQIEAFAHAARERSISKAAASLGVTQSSVTQHVTKLEKIMGTQLFVRRHGGLELTRAGYELFEVADRWTTLEQLIEEKVESYSTLTGGHLKIIATAPRPAMPVVERYSARYPSVGIEFSLYDWTRCMRLLREREVDIAILTEPEELPGLYVRPVSTTRYLAYMRRDHRLTAKQTLSFADLAEETVILPEDGSLTQRVVNEKTRALGIEFTRVIKTATFPVVKEAVLHGVGVGIFLEDCLFPSSKLTARPVSEMPETYRDCIATPADKRGLRLVQSFLDEALPDGA